MRSADQKDIEQIPRDHWGFMQRMHGRRQTLVVPRQYTLRQLLLAFVVFALFMGAYRWAHSTTFSYRKRTLSKRATRRSASGETRTARSICRRMPS